MRDRLVRVMRHDADVMRHDANARFVSDATRPLRLAAPANEFRPRPRPRPPRDVEDRV